MSLTFRLGWDVDVYWRSPEGKVEHLAHYHAWSISWLEELAAQDPQATSTYESDYYMPGFMIRARDLIPLLLDGPPEWQPMRSPYGVLGGPVDVEMAGQIPSDDWLMVRAIDTS